METLPKISCLCISQNSVELIKRTINCFKAQTYPAKELIILYESDNSSTKYFLKENLYEEVYFYEIPSHPKLTLGALRNISIEKCSGEYFCQWDDDDWYASNRLEVQYKAIVHNSKAASMLAYWLMYDHIGEQAYLSSFRLWEGSILCKRSLVDNNIKYADLTRSEDTSLLKQLIDGNHIFPIIKPNLYIYTFHGSNTWGYDHFKIFFKKSLKLSSNASEIVRNVLNEHNSVRIGTEMLNSEDFLQEVVFRYNFIDNYSLQLL